MDFFVCSAEVFDHSELEPSEYDCDFQGLSTGWADYYHGMYDCQWFDITGLPSGDYTIRFSINMDRQIEESNYDNNVREFPVVITDEATPPAPAPENDICADAIVTYWTL